MKPLLEEEKASENAFTERSNPMIKFKPVVIITNASSLACLLALSFCFGHNNNIECAVPNQINYSIFQVCIGAENVRSENFSIFRKLRTRWDKPRDKLFNHLTHTCVVVLRIQRRATKDRFLSTIPPSL